VDQHSACASENGSFLYIPSCSKRGGVSTFMCQGQRSRWCNRSSAVKPIHQDRARNLGCSVDVARDREGARIKPRDTGLGCPSDRRRLALRQSRDRQQDNPSHRPPRPIKAIRRFLAARAAARAFRAFARWAGMVLQGGRLTMPSPRPLAHCAQLSKQTCKLYAVDDDCGLGAEESEFSRRTRA